MRGICYLYMIQMSLAEAGYVASQVTYVALLIQPFYGCFGVLHLHSPSYSNLSISKLVIVRSPHLHSLSFPGVVKAPWKRPMTAMTLSPRK